jgi:hypothetical protein
VCIWDLNSVTPVKYNLIYFLYFNIYKNTHMRACRRTHTLLWRWELCERNESSWRWRTKVTVSKVKGLWNISSQNAFEFKRQITRWCLQKCDLMVRFVFGLKNCVSHEAHIYKFDGKCFNEIYKWKSVLISMLGTWINDIDIYAH